MKTSAKLLSASRMKSVNWVQILVKYGILITMITTDKDSKSIQADMVSGKLEVISE